MRTHGISHKMYGAILTMLASASSLATSYVETGELSKLALGALVGTVFSAIGVAIGDLGNVEEDGFFAVDLGPHPNMVGTGKGNGLQPDSGLGSVADVNARFGGPHGHAV